MSNKTKDGPKARKDLELLDMRKDLHMPCKKSSEEMKTEAEVGDRGKKAKKKGEEYCPPPASPYI